MVGCYLALEGTMANENEISGEHHWCCAAKFGFANTTRRTNGSNNYLSAMADSNSWSVANGVAEPTSSKHCSLAETQWTLLPWAHSSASWSCRSEPSYQHLGSLKEDRSLVVSKDCFRKGCSGNHWSAPGQLQFCISWRSIPRGFPPASWETQGKGLLNGGLWLHRLNPSLGAWCREKGFILSLGNERWSTLPKGW
jgi:hypothetical protein